LKIAEMRDNLSLLGRLERRMKAGNILSARAEAEQLIRHFGRMSRLDLFSGEKTVSPKTRRSLEQALQRRLGGFPLSYVLKEAEFFGRKFFVTPHTLIPRPETEILAEEALKLLDAYYFNRGDGIKNVRVLDVGTGCGNLAVSLTMERPGCRMTALDISGKALQVSRKNINRHGLGKRVQLFQSDLFGVFGRNPRQKAWDVIVSNPPYIPGKDLRGLSREVRSEPRLALDGGPGGFKVLNRILRDAPRYLSPGGWLLMEIGDGQSGILAEEILKRKLWRDWRFVKDYNRKDRVLVARKNG
jgi:release factor glutamine methyltransferase